LDLVAKTPVAEIHLFDGDVFLNHNAFRCPGAASLEDLSKKQQKVVYLAALYSRMRKNIIPHYCFIEEATVEQLKGMSFIFLCIDKGTGKRLIVERLEEWGIPFIDAGMGIQLGEDNTIGGILEAGACLVSHTTSLPIIRLCGHLDGRRSRLPADAPRKLGIEKSILLRKTKKFSQKIRRWIFSCGQIFRSK
jgi:hypothetical protein